MHLTMTTSKSPAIPKTKDDIRSKDHSVKSTVSFNAFMLVFMFGAFALLHTGGLIFIYNKVLRLETLGQKDSVTCSKDKARWDSLLEERTRQVVKNELDDLQRRQLESLRTGDVEPDISLNHRPSHTENNTYPKGPIAKVQNISIRDIPNQDIHKEDSSRKDSHGENSEKVVSTRAKRNTRHNRMLVDESRSDELSVQLQGQSSDEADKSWLQLTSYARIPYNAIQEFCSKTRASCPPGPEGLKGPVGDRGLPGHKGDHGDRGLPGIQGPRGPSGLPGITGPPGYNGRKGELGPPGIPGLDGRDGLPGEPGLDGIPGRNGLDGIPGVDGVPGFDGFPGKHGRNGTDGKPGSRGEKGDRGPIGPRGIAGPRGRLGKNGTPGTPGVPGISTWIVNGTKVAEILIPPSIPGTKRRRKTIVVREKDNLRLLCDAVGKPRPQIEWTREDGMAIATGQWKDGSLVSNSLNLTHIRRDHTGIYRCEANNGIPPIDYKTFDVEVHFDPYVRVNNWKVGAYNGSTAILECHVEAFPVAVTYWEDRRGRILENSTKHRIHLRQDKGFVWKSSMFLEIFNIRIEDFGGYHCVAKNDLSMTRGLVKVHEIDPNRYVPSTGTVDGLTFGPEPPSYSELFNDLCPAPVQCPTCPPSKRPESRGSLYCLRVQQFGNDTYPGFTSRKLDCELSAVGKPVYHRHTDSDFGAWMRDPLPRDPKEETRFWTTSPKDRLHIFEYSDKIKFRKDMPTRNYTLRYPFQGNSHVVYNGSFFYHQRARSSIVKYDMLSGISRLMRVPKLSLDTSNYLYNGGKDFIDLNTDENGLWAIYGLPDSNNTVVMKIESATLKVEYSWNVSLSHRKFGEMFITCGVLYGIDSSVKRDTKIRFALDLYKKNILDVDLPFTNPFSKTTMLGYNPLTKEIYSWDDGNQLTYPIKYIDIGYDTPFEDGGAEAKARTKLLDYENDYVVDNE